MNTNDKEITLKKYSFRYPDNKSKSERIDYFLAKKLSISRSRVKRSIESRIVSCNGKPLNKHSFLLNPGDVIYFELLMEEKPDLLPEKMPINYIYKDEDILVLDKSAGIIVHPGVKNPKHTLLNGIINDYPNIKDVGDPDRPGIVHRLDKETSGIIIIAKNNRSFESLYNMFKSREIHKEYIGLVKGVIKQNEGTIKSPIARHPKLKIKQAVVENGKKSITNYQLIKIIKNYSLLRIHILTGRMHQIRVHLSSIGHPVVGDTLYGKKSKELDDGRHFLHANKITFNHPVNGKIMKFESKLPEDLKMKLNIIENHK